MELSEIWETTGTIEGFVDLADTNGYGLWSIREFLEAEGKDLSEEEIDKIRCPYLY